MQTCPSNQTLGGFLGDRLSPDEDQAVVEHLEVCRQCNGRVEALTRGEFLDSPGAAATPPIGASLDTLKRRLYGLGEVEIEPRPLADLERRDFGGVAEAFSLPARVGRFIIERPLGAGGFGQVVLAIDPVLNRQVALKFPRNPAIVDPAQRSRFLREAKAAANLQHPNIVPVYEAGEVNCLCYLAAQYVPGPNLAQWLSQEKRPQPPTLAAQLILALAQAVEHAHQRGILHRDIKPANILLDLGGASDEVPFVPKLTDFGLAKAQEDADVTMSGALFGTPRYMAPEQAGARRDEIGPATDVYALGVVLYELVTARPPILGGDNADTLRRVVSDQPPRPCRLVPGLPRDLEAICMKCLEKAPARRYRTAADLASDLQRFLVCQPTHARPLNSFWRGLRWCRRKPVAAALVAVLVLAAAIGPPVAVKQSLLAASEAQARLDAETATRKEQRARQDADDARQKVERQAADIKQAADNLRVNLYRAEMDLAGQAWREGDMPRVLALLDQTRPHKGEKDLRGFEWFHWWRRSHDFRWRLDGVTHWTSAPTISPDGRWIAIPHYDSRALYLYDGQSGRLLRTVSNKHHGCVAFSPDSQRLTYTDSANELKIVEVSTGEHRTSLTGANWFMNAAFASDGRALATLDAAQTVTVWNLQGGQSFRSWKIPERFATIRYSQDDSLIITSPQGGVANQKGAYRFWNVATGEQTRSFGADWQSPDWHSALSPDGSTLAVADSAGVRFWDVQSGDVSPMQLSATDISYLTYSPGNRLATCHWDTAVRFWDVATGAFLEAFKGHSTSVGHLAFSADGATWLSASSFPLKELLVWNTSRPRAHQSLNVHGTTISVASGRNASIAVSRDAENSLKTWDLSTGQLIRALTVASPERPASLRNGLAMSDDGEYVAAGERSGSITVWNTSSGEVHSSWKSDEAKELRALAFSADGRRLASAGSKIAVWNVASGQLERTFVGHPQLSRDVAGKVVKVFEGGTSNVTGMGFSPNGRTLATSAVDYRVRLWDVAAGNLIHELIEHRGFASGVLFSPDSSLVASTSIDRTVKLWDAKEGRLIETLSKRDVSSAMAFSPDGKLLAFAGPQNTIRLWHLPTGEICSTLGDTHSEVTSLAFAGGGRYLVGASGGDLHIWRTATAAESEQTANQIGEHPPDVP